MLGTTTVSKGRTRGPSSGSELHRPSFFNRISNANNRICSTNVTSKACDNCNCTISSCSTAIQYSSPYQTSPLSPIGVSTPSYLSTNRPIPSPTPAALSTAADYSNYCHRNQCNVNSLLWPTLPSSRSAFFPPLSYPFPPLPPKTSLSSRTNFFGSYSKYPEGALTPPTAGPITPTSPSSGFASPLHPEPAKLYRSNTTISTTATSALSSASKSINSKPTLLKLERNTSEVTESLFAAGGGFTNTPPASSRFLPVSAFDLVAKNFHQAGSAAVAFSQANSIFLQSQTDYLSGTTSAGGTISSKKTTETCFGRWQHHSSSTLEPLHIQVPPIAPITNLTIKTESISCGSSRSTNSSKFDELTATPNPHQQYQSSYHLQQLQSHSNVGRSLQQHHQYSSASSSVGIGNGETGSGNGLVTTMSTSHSPLTTSNVIVDLNNGGCRRTIPISWTSSKICSSAGDHSHQHHASSPSISSTSSNSGNCATLLQIKREPCQVSEVTTSNHLLERGNNIVSCGGRGTATAHILHHHNSHQRLLAATSSSSTSAAGGLSASRSSLTAVVKIESSSPKGTNNIMDNHAISAAAASQSSAGAIPVGIAVARQRLQEHTTTVSHQPKEVNRFAMGIADIGGATSLSQNMFFTGTNSMIPLTSTDGLTMGVPNVQNAVRTPPTLWQYPTPVPVESMLPMPMPPVGFQLVRDPSTGQFLFLPTATTIEPFQQAVVWPTYPQATAAMQPPAHLLLPQISQQLQPPPLAPLQLLGSDYLTASTTLHQHTQTHSTRLVALTSDTKRKQSTVHGSAIPLPIPHHAVIKIEDCSSGSTTTNGAGGTTSHHHHQAAAAIFGTGPTTGSCSEDKTTGRSMHTAATITTAMQTNDMSPNIASPQLYYHNSNAGLIQIAPSTHSQTTTAVVPAQTASSNSLHHHHHHLNHQQHQHHQECNRESPPPLALAVIPPSIIAPSPQPSACLTPPPDQISLDNLEATTSCVPDVQDATIQTDTPVMSEDDNTVEAEDYSLASQTSCINSEETREVLIPATETPPIAVCQIASSNYEEASILSKTLQKQSSEREVNGNDSGFDSTNAVTSTNSLEETSCVTEAWNSSGNTEHDDEDQQNSNISGPENYSQKQEYYKEIVKATSTPVDISGLELLSNISIEAFEKKIVYIKKEPIEERPLNVYATKLVHSSEDCGQSVELANTRVLANDKFSGEDEQLGGLNLLCALAEQRIQEEVGQRSRKRSSSSTDSQSSKKKKHKHSKSSKKSRHEKELRKEKRRHRHSLEDSEEQPSPERGEDEYLKETLTRVRSKYKKCASCKNNDGSPHCCREKCNWPTPEELISAMETDMRLRLADITRQCQEKKRELAEISPILQQRKNQLFSDRESNSTPLSGKSTISRSFQPVQATKFGAVMAVSPANVSSESFGSVELPKLSSDTESSKFEDVESSSSISSKRKGVMPRKNDDGNTETIVAKKPKSLVGYILASKNRFSNGVKDKNTVESAGFFTDDASVFSESSSCKLRASAFKTDLATSIKQEHLEEDPVAFASVAKPPMLESFAMFSDNSSFSATVAIEKKLHRKSSKHHSKHKKSKSNRERKHRSSEMRERKRRIDASCLLTEEHLDKEKIRVLTSMGGLFYAGVLTALQPPDVYAVTLDGERGNRPHIMSREEILRDAIIEIAPSSVEEVPPGTRLCAYWSQQYRCLYPGTAAEPGTPDPIHDRKFICVEFDDGDSGRIALEDIRFLLSDYPIVEYDPNPLLSLGKRKRSRSQTVSDVVKLEQLQTSNISAYQMQSKSTNSFILDATSGDNQIVKHGFDLEAYKERRRLKKMRKDRLKKLESMDVCDDVAERKHKRKHKCGGDELCKHRKHKKRRKHKKHHHREVTVAQASPSVDSSHDAEDMEEEEEEEEEDQQNTSPTTTDETEEGTTTNSPEEDITEIDDDNISQNENVEECEQETPITDKQESVQETLLIQEFNPNVKEDTMTEEEVASSITESSGSVYEPSKKKDKQNSTDNHSKIAAFLPARQLWGWSGKSYRRANAKGRGKKLFYKSIQRGKEAITIGDSAVFLSTGRPDRPYIGRIESMWETSTSNKVVRVKWFYHPEETKGCPSLRFPGALFESPHEDENDVQTISHKCEVLPLDTYTNKFGLDPNQYTSIYDNNDTYYLAGQYDPTALKLNLKSNIPVSIENDDND